MPNTLGIFSGFAQKWSTIESLKVLDDAELMEFWKQVDEVIALFSEETTRTEKPELLFRSIQPTVMQLFRLGDYTRTEEIVQKVYDASVREKNHQLQTRSAIFLGYIYFNLQKFQKAEDIYLQTMSQLDNSLQDQIKNIILLSNLSMVVGFRGKFEQAASYAHSALRILNRLPRKQFDKMASEMGSPLYSSQQSGAMSNLGAIYLEIAREAPGNKIRNRYLGKASRCFVRSTMGAISLEDKFRSQANFGLTLMLRDRYSDADKLYRRLVRKCEKIPELHRVTSWIYGFRAELALRLGKPEEALALCHRSLRMAIHSADPVREAETILASMDPLKKISKDVFQGNHKSSRFENNGMRVINQLLEFLEDKDWYTARDHSQGVRRISLHLFDVMTDQSNMIEHDRKTVEIAALLHDIGKLWVPWTILNRTTPLWDREFELIKGHPSRGGEFLEDLGFSIVGKLLSKHHERPDGTGYPTGHEIGGLAGRILAVADCFEAMTTVNRLYRKPKTHEEAVRIINELAGRQFDHRVVNALPKALIGYHR